MLKIYITNLGKYNEGELVGEWISLPCEDEDLQKLFIKIGVGEMIDGKYKHGKNEVVDGYEYIYEEYAIHDHECDIEGLEIKEYSSIERLNKIAQALDEVNDWDLKCLKALIEMGCANLDDVKDSGDIRLKLEGYCFSEIEKSENSAYTHNTDKLLGYHLAELNGVDSEINKLNIGFYFDYESYGRDARFNGTMLASNGIVATYSR